MTRRKLVCYHESCLISLKMFFGVLSRNVFSNKWKGNWKQLILIEGSWLQKLYQLWNETLFINIIISKSQRKKWRIMVCPNHMIYLYVFIELIHDKGMIIQMCLFIWLNWLFSLSYNKKPYIWNNKSNVNWNFSSFWYFELFVDENHRIIWRKKLTIYFYMYIIVFSLSNLQSIHL